MSEPMRVCLLVDGETVPRWQADALSSLLERDDIELTSLVYNDYERTRSVRDVLERAVELREWTPVAVLSSVFARPIPQTDPVRLDSVVDLDAVRELHVEPTIVDGWKQEIPRDAVEEIASDAVVAIRFGFGFLVGPVLSELEHGVLSYHHGDLREYRGQPMGFWEFVHGERTAGITVQQLTERLDAGGIAAVKTVPIDDFHTLGAVRRRLFDSSEDMLGAAVERLQNDAVHEPDSLGDLYTLPKGVPVLQYAAKNAWGYIRESSETPRKRRSPVE